MNNTTNTSYLTEAAEIVARNQDAMKMPESVADFELSVARAGLNVEAAERLHGDLLEAHRLAVEANEPESAIDEIETQIAAATKAGNRAQIAHDAACRHLAGAVAAEQDTERTRRIADFKQADTACRAGLRKLQKAGEAYQAAYDEVRAQKLDSGFFETMNLAKQIGCQLQCEQFTPLSAEPVRVAREVLHFYSALSGMHARVSTSM